MKRCILLLIALFILALAGPRPSAARRARAPRHGHPALRLAGQRPAAVPNQWVVKFSPRASQAQRAQLQATARAEVVSAIPQLGIQTVQLPALQSAAVYAR